MSSRRRVMITGATGKIGRSLASGFAGAGWEVIAVSREQNRADAIAETLGRATGDVHHGVCWTFEAGAPIAELVEQLHDKAIQPHCLVNGVRDLENLKLGEGGHADETNWSREFHLGVVVAYELAMQLFEKPGTVLDNIINIASVYGMVAPNQSLYADPVSQSAIHYGVCKAALIHLTRELAVRMTSKGVRVNAISYGGVEGRVDSGFLERYKRLCPQGRMLTEADVTGPALFLSSPGASGIVGHNLVVDGGWSVW